ncbi:hypothetical protein M9Y10_025510 [Tritrichomonas musculus]|uniref:Right handed beta helix domain-containing protein n=1 Tax=Tritrichomonas musculus TaxID=1915356 RepID=A0ABR2H8U8_9EUKA
MLFILLFSLIQAQKRICICNNECSSQCPADNFISTPSNQQFENFISKFKYYKEFEFIFYSSSNNFEFKIDLAHFPDKKITLKTTANSKSVKVITKEDGNLFDKIINIEPGYQVILPDPIPYKSALLFDKNLLEEPEETPIPISVGLAQMEHTGSIDCNLGSLDSSNNQGCDYTNLDTEAAYQCGFRCWTSGSTSFEYTFKGVKFQIYGTFAPAHGTINLQIDEGETIPINENGDRQEYAVIYTSEVLEYGDHKIRLSSDEVYELYKLSYWPSLKARRLNSTQLTKTLSWFQESDGIGGVREYTQEAGATASATISGSKVWIYGSKASGHSTMKISFATEEEFTASEASDTRIDGALLYESNEITFGNYPLSITSEGTILIYCVYYEYNPPPQTQTPPETPQETPLPSSTPDPSPTVSPTPDPSQTPDPSSTPEPTPLPSLTPLPTSTPLPTPIPISVGLVQMTVTGSVSCSPEDVQFDIANINNLNCNTENLDSVEAYQCGFRCWTSSANFEYTFKGVKFEVYGTYDPLHGSFDLIIDEGEAIEINEHSDARQAYSVIYSSEELEYKEHHIEIKNKGMTYELYKITYWPSLKTKRINSTQLEKTQEWKLESDGIGGVREYTEQSSSTASKTIQCSKIWIYGTTAGWFGSANINFNNEEKSVSVYSADRVDGVLLYESDELSFGTYPLTITSNGIIMINSVYCLYDPPPQTLAPYPSPSPEQTPIPTASPIPTPIPISVGLTQMTVTGSVSCSPEDVEFTPGNTNHINCNTENLDSVEAYQCGFRCWTSSANFEYTFKGVKFEVYGTYDPLHGSFDLIIDEGEAIEINEYSDARQAYSVIYSSEELEYKEHHIEIKNKGMTYELYKITYWPSLKAKRINSTYLTKTQDWRSESDGIGGVREYTDVLGGSASTSLQFSRIWVFGTTTSWFHSMIINVGSETTKISVNTEYRIDGALLYDSEDISFNEYTITFTSSDGPPQASTIMLSCIYYIDEPAIATQSISASQSPKATPTVSQSPEPTSTPDPTHTPFPTPSVSQSPDPTFTPAPTFTPMPTQTPTPTPVPISVGLTQMTLSGRVYCNIAYFGAENLQNLGCNLDDLEAESAYKCGYKCWSYGDANFSYTFKGVRFELYGTFDPFHKKFDLIIDDRPPIEVDEYNESRFEYVLIYTSEDLEYKEHTIQIKGKGLDQIYELYKLVYWPRIGAKRLNSTQLAKTKSWVRESDGIGGIREYTNEASGTARTTLVCTKFWVYSCLYYLHTDLVINVNGDNRVAPLFSQDRKDGVLVYESEELTYGSYSITFASTGIAMLYCIYYLDDPPPPTQTPYPSRTEYPESNTTYIDKVFINYILHDQIEVTNLSLIDQISGCSFINMLENIDFLIRLEKEIPFFDNLFEFNELQENPPAPIYCQFNGQLTIKNCTFKNQRCRTKGGNVFTSDSSYVIDVTFESCKFINCGNSSNEVIIKLDNKDCSINMTDCFISFENETISSKVIEATGSEVIIDNCNFHKSGTIYIDSQNSNKTIQYTNNVASSIEQQFICILNLDTDPIICNNIFKDVLVSNVSFIYIIHNQEEIEIKNATFQNITLNEFDVYGGSIGLFIQHTNRRIMTTLILNQCFFIDNVNNHSNSDPIFSTGGAFQCGYSSTIANISLQIINCEFKRNHCINGKGGALSLNICNDISITNTTFEGNFAAEEGGAIYLWGKVIQDVDPDEYEDPIIFDSLRIETFSLTNCIFIGNQGTEGSCIYIVEENVHLINFVVDSCAMIDNACYSSQKFTIASSSMNVKFTNNNVTFTRASSNKSGSLLLNFTESSEIIDSYFNNCQTLNDSSLQINNIGIQTITTNIDNCTFINCIARKYVVSIPNGISIVHNCSFQFTLSRNACSGLEISSPTRTEIRDCEFESNNNKVLNAGSLHIHNDDGKSPEKVDINGLLFNSCVGSSYRTLSIALTSFNDDQLVIENVCIENISTGSSIYGINVNKNIHFKKWIFRNNVYSNHYGGGYGSYMIPSQHILFDECEWINNYCSDNGGAFGGVITYNDEDGDSLLMLKSVTFNNCVFILNSALGNGGALYLDMTAENSLISITGCTFEVNKAFGDCGAIFVKNKNDLIIENCHFLNNSAIKSLSSIDPTDTLYINGNAFALISNTNFTKGSYLDDQTNYQFTHINDNNQDSSDFNVTITRCMFSIINPSRNQFYAQEAENVGRIFITFSTFTHFVTDRAAALFLDGRHGYTKVLAEKSDFNHLFENLNANIFITDCCFDSNEAIIRSKLSAHDASKQIKQVQENATENQRTGQKENENVSQKENSRTSQKENAKVVENVNAKVVENVNAKVVENVNAKVVENVNAKVVENVNAKVVENVNATVSKIGNATVSKIGNATVSKIGNAKVSKIGNATVSKIGNAKVSKIGNATVGLGVNNSGDVFEDFDFVDEVKNEVSEASVTSGNNTINGECFYPEIVDDLILAISNFEYPSYSPVTSSVPSRKPKSDKTKIILGAAIGAVGLVIVVSAIILIVLLRKKKKRADSQIKRSVDFDEEQGDEMEQETNDSLNSRYDRNFNYFQTQMITQENPLYTHVQQAQMNSSASSDEDTSFEESHWGNEII